MKTLVLTNTAARRLKDIAIFTIDKFGKTQAGKYENQLKARLSGICRDEAPHGRPCNIMQGVELSENRLFFYREGMHYIIYEPTDDRIIVHDFVHVARNIPELIASIEKKILN